MIIKIFILLLNGYFLFHMALTEQTEHKMNISIHSIIILVKRITIDRFLSRRNPGRLGGLVLFELHQTTKNYLETQKILIKQRNTTRFPPLVCAVDSI